MSEETPVTPEPEVTIPKAQHDEQIAKLNARIEQMKGEAEQTAKQLEELTGKAKTAEELEAEIARIKTESEETAKKFEQETATLKVTSALDKALIAAGCIDADVTRAAIDLSAVKLDGDKLEGVDIDKLKESKPYLFGTPKVRDVGAPSTGNLASDDDDLRGAFGLPTKEK